MPIQNNRWFRAILFTMLLIGWGEPGRGQSQASPAGAPPPTDDQSAADASKQAANPLASSWLMQFQQNDTWLGKGTRVQSNLYFQPLLSAKLTDNWTLLSRPVIEMFSSTPYQNATGESRRVTGFGDTALAFAVSPGHALVGNWLLALGPTFIFPTATESLLGQNKWQFGPTAAVGYVGAHFIAYVFPQQWFSIGGDGRKTSQMSAQWAFVYFLSHGWSIGTNPNGFVNWEAPSGNRVAFPVGPQIGKLVKLGAVPVKFDLQFEYYPVHPDAYGPKWNIQLQVTPILPALIKKKLL